MPRRTIDPEFFTNEKIGQLPHSWRLMILGLILKAADDQGRATANPALLRAAILPFDDLPLAEIDQCLEWLVENNTIQLYDSGGKRYLQISNWWHYQDWMQFAQPSKLPPPPGWKDRIRVNVDRGGIATYNWVRKDGTVIADSCDQSGKPFDPPSAPYQGPPPTKGKPPSGKLTVEAKVEPAPPATATIESAEAPTWRAPAPMSNLNGRVSVTETRELAHLKKVAKRLKIKHTVFVGGKIPEGAGANGAEVFYEFNSGYTEDLTEFNRDRLSEVKDLERLRMVMRCWLGANNKPDNITGILNWCRNGVPNYARDKETAVSSADHIPDFGGDSTSAGSGAAVLGQRAGMDFEQASAVFGRRR